METCYRHPGRETGVSCSNCGRPICPDCMTTTSVGMRCPECARQRTKVKTMGSVTEPMLTYILIGDQRGGGAGRLARRSQRHGRRRASEAPPCSIDGAVSRFGVDSGDYWRIVTAGFLHAGFLHLLFNMFALYVLGATARAGRRPPALRGHLLRLAARGLVRGAAARAHGATVGASGAVFGLMGAAVVVMRNRGVNPMESGLGLWIGLNLLITFTIPDISIGGHIGGLVGGALAAFILFDLPRPASACPPWFPRLLAGAIGVVAVVGSIVVSSSPTAF